MGSIQGGAHLWQPHSYHPDRYHSGNSAFLELDATNALLNDAVAGCEEHVEKIRNLEADNAALTARVKGKDAYIEELANTITDLEAKLAAAEKALEPFAKELSERHDKIFRLEPAPDSECVGFTQLTYGHFREARAALEDRP